MMLVEEKRWCLLKEWTDQVIELKCIPEEDNNAEDDCDYHGDGDDDDDDLAKMAATVKICDASSAGITIFISLPLPLCQETD